MSTKVLTTTYTIPNSKDDDEWFAGGTLRDEFSPGGEYYSTYNSLSFENHKKKSLDYSTSLYSGYFMSLLLSSLTKINNIINGGNYLDLMRDYEVKYTNVINYEITITDEEGEILSTSSGDVDISNIETLGLNKNVASIEDIYNMNKNSFNMISMIQNPNPINIALTVRDMYNKEMTFEQAVGAGLIGSVKGVMTSFVNKAVASALGINVTTVAQAISVNFVGGLILGELVEMALGLDTSFGWGGGYNQEASRNLGLTAFKESKGFLGFETLGKDLSYSLGLSDENYGDLTDAAGNKIGGYYTSEGGINQEDMTGYGLSYGQAYNDYLNQVTKEFAYDYGLPDYNDSEGLDNALEDERMEDIDNALDAIESYNDGDSDSGMTGDGTDQDGVGGYGDGNGGFGGI